MLVRHATVDDMAAIQALVDWGASTGELVPCHAEELAERLDQFWVVAESDQILGVCALRPVAENLAELCSLAVWPERQRHGLIALRNRDWYLLKAILTEDLVWTLPVRV